MNERIPVPLLCYDVTFVTLRAFATLLLSDFLAVAVGAMKVAIRGGAYSRLPLHSCREHHYASTERDVKSTICLRSEHKVLDFVRES
jgi:hypothetical protein